MLPGTRPDNWVAKAPLVDDPGTARLTLVAGKTFVACKLIQEASSTVFQGGISTPFGEKYSLITLK